MTVAINGEFKTIYIRHIHIYGDICSIYKLVKDLKQELSIQHIGIYQNSFSISYDIRYMHFSKIINIIDLNGLKYKDSPYYLFKYRMYDDIDLNARENLDIDGFCCDKVKIRKENL